MNEKKLYDISEVCKMFGTTSRTLRFYEEQGILQSTTVGLSSRRRYTEEQIAVLKNVLVLRTLGLSVKAIADIQNRKLDLKEAVLSKRAEIYAVIESHTRKINLLNEAVAAIESDKDLFIEEWIPSPMQHAEENGIARKCTDAVLNGDDETLYRYLSPRVAKYMPTDVYRAVRKDTLAPLGKFVATDQTITDETLPNKQYSFVRFEKLGLKITYIFYGGKIDGFWLGYYEIKR